MTKEEIKRRFKDIEVIYSEPVILRSGKTSPFYCDIKKSYGYPDIAKGIAEEIARLVPKDTTCIAASGYGGLPLAALVASIRDLKLAAVRSELKNHGKGGFVDGYVPNENDRVTIIDDVLTTGSSILETIENLKPAKAKIESAVVVVRRGEAQLPIPCFHLFSIDELISDEK